MKNNVRRAMPTATAIAVALLLAAVLLSLPGRNIFGLADAEENMPIEEYAEWVKLKSLEACLSVHGNGTAVTPDEWVAFSVKGASSLKNTVTPDEWVAASVLGSMFHDKEWNCQDVNDFIMNVRHEHADSLLNLNGYAEDRVNCSEEGVKAYAEE